MRKPGLIIGTIVVAAALLLGNSINGHASSRDEQAIRDVENKMIASTNTDELMNYYDQNDVDVYDLAGPLQYEGNAAVRGDFDNVFANFAGAKGNFVELVVVTDGQMGMARSIQHFAWTDKAGKPQEVTVRVTDVFHKVDGQWKVIHTHISAPMDPKTGLTQTHLKS
jgi:ketosteroid isomerase-like protein